MQTQNSHIISSIAVHSKLCTAAPIAAAAAAACRLTAIAGGACALLWCLAGGKQGDVSWSDYARQGCRALVVNDELAAGARP